MRCEAKTKAGARCRAQAVSGGPLCWAHAPQLGKKRAQAHAQGGRRNRTPHAAPVDILPEKIASIQDARRILDYVKLELIPQKNTERRARAFMMLHDQYIKSIAACELEERVKALEQASTK